MIILKAKIKFTKSSCTYLPWHPRWVSNLGSTVTMAAISVALYANWCESKVGGSQVMIYHSTSFSMHFITSALSVT